MEPQWNLFQPSMQSVQSTLDYNRPNQNRGNISVNNSLPSNNFQDYPPNQYYNNRGNRNVVQPDYSYSSYYKQPSSGNGMNMMNSQSQNHSNVSNYYSSGRSSPQYNPPLPDFKIGTFSLDMMTNDSSNSNSSQSNNYSNGSNASQIVRETGIIEKLLQTYGFIQCCERQARLFFHFSQFDGNTEHLRIGDPVEFEVTFDKRTGKPIASSVTKISPEVVLSEERVIGSVTTELKCESNGEQQGRITYENRGECFFLPYGKEDVEGYVTLKPGDKVSFQIATNQRSGNLAARHVRLENPVQPVKYQGVVSAIKESYGFIERADVVDEIFFHFSEAKTVPEGLKLGDDVEFLIQSRNGKEVAANMVKLPQGTVVFEDINPEEVKGQVLKPVEKVNRQNQKDPLTGRIRYRGKDRSEVEVKFGERDQKGDFTLKHGDWVEFNIATDRRDHLQKATNINLLDESFYVSGEKREQGIIGFANDGFGYIKCADRDVRMHFSFDELLDTGSSLSVGDEVQFSVASDQNAPPPNRQTATRIRKLPQGTVKFEVQIQENVEGEVSVEASELPSTYVGVNNEEQVQPGIITFTTDTMKQTVNYYLNNSDTKLHIGDQVMFNIYLIKRTKERIATDIRIISHFNSAINSVSFGRQSMVGSGRTFDRGPTNLSTIPLPTSTNSEHINHSVSNSYEPPISANLADMKVPESPVNKDVTSINNHGTTINHLNNHCIPVSHSNSQGMLMSHANSHLNQGSAIGHSNNQGALISHSNSHSSQGAAINHSNSHSSQGAAINHSNSHSSQGAAIGHSNNQGASISHSSQSASVGHSNNQGAPISHSNSQGVSIGHPRNQSATVSHSNSQGASIGHANNQGVSDNQSSHQTVPVSHSNSQGSLMSRTSNNELTKDSSNGEVSETQQEKKEITRNSNNKFSSHPTPIHYGYIAALKESFGFIETLNHDKEIFFHYSNVEEDSNNLELGQEVEYTIASRTGPAGKLSAENVRLLPLGSLPSPKILGEVFEGIVLRSMRSANPDQQEYCGLVCVGKEEEKLKRHQFGIIGLKNKKELLQPGDQITFQLDEDGWAVNISANRKKLIAVVEAVKGQYGFLNYENEEGKKLFFHQSEVKDGIVLSPGDEVQFVVITNQKTGKSSACNITRLAASGPSQRPDRLVSKLKNLNVDSSKPRVTVLRQPKGPDGTKGFKLERIF